MSETLDSDAQENATDKVAPTASRESSGLSIAIVSYHSPLSELQLLLDSLLEAIARLREVFSLTDITIYLIDNSPEGELQLDEFAAVYAKADQEEVAIVLLQGHGNVGYGAAHNLAINRTESTYHLILNPDVILDRECLHAGLAYMQSHPEVAMASPFATTPNGAKQYLCKRYPSVLVFLLRALPSSLARLLFGAYLDRFEMRELSESQATSNIPIISGCFMLCQTEAIKKQHGFNENYFLYFEDFDLSLRVGKTSQLAYVPTMKISHGGGNSFRKGLRHIRLFMRSGWRFFNTHGWRIW